MAFDILSIMRLPRGRCFAVCLALLAAGCAGSAPQRSGGIADHVADASDRFDVPEVWIYEVMRVESGMRTHFDDGSLITSHAGAMGLMQVMPATYEELRQRYDLGHDPHEPRNNVMAGAAYIREMYDLFGSPGFLGAYNAGPGRYGRYLEGDATLPGETQRYMAMIAPRIDGHAPSGRTAILAARPTPQPYVAPTTPVVFARNDAPAAVTSPATLGEIPDNLTTFQIRLLYPELVPVAAVPNQVSQLGPR